MFFKQYSGWTNFYLWFIFLHILTAQINFGGVSTQDVTWYTSIHFPKIYLSFATWVEKIKFEFMDNSEFMNVCSPWKIYVINYDIRCCWKKIGCCCLNENLPYLLSHEIYFFLEMFIHFLTYFSVSIHAFDEV